MNSPPAIFSRDETRALHDRSWMAGATVFAFDFAGFLAASAGAAVWDSWVARGASAILAGVFTGALLVVGHDACHHALTPFRLLNRFLGTLAFLPSLHAYSLWDLSHNRLHHRYLNRRGKDYAWEPLTPDEYARLSVWQRLRYRLYRTAAGHFFYYLVEIWWRKIFYPRSAEIGGYAREYRLDLAAVTVWMIAWPAALVGLRFVATGFVPTAGDAVQTVFVSALLPFLVFNVVNSSSLYLQHTHPGVAWYREEDDVDPETIQIRSAVHLILPWLPDSQYHRIMHHTAHHLRPGIPCYRLKESQALLESRRSEVIVERYTPGYHWRTLATCKLFDLDRRCWTDYDGVPTGPSIPFPIKQPEPNSPTADLPPAATRLN